jgi:predicted dinucleotide-binding enzyme
MTMQRQYRRCEPHRPISGYAADHGRADRGVREDGTGHRYPPDQRRTPRAHRRSRPAKAESLAAELNGTATGEARGDPGDAEVVILVLPYPANRDVAGRWAGRLDGKVVVDIANPVDSATFDDLATTAGLSSAEEVAAAALGARVAKAFNTTFSPTLTSDARLDILIAGDDAGAKQALSKLVSDGGMRPLDVGGLKHARALEAFQLLHMRVQEQIGGQQASALAFGVSPRND